MKIFTLQLQMMAELDLAQVGVSFWWFFHQGKLSMYSNYKWLMWETNAYFSHKSAYFYLLIQNNSLMLSLPIILLA